MSCLNRFALALVTNRGLTFIAAVARGYRLFRKRNEAEVAKQLPSLNLLLWHCIQVGHGA